MKNRMLRVGLFAVPLALLTVGLVTACDDDVNTDPSGLPTEAGADAAQADSSVAPGDGSPADSGNVPRDGGMDSASDAGADADADAAPLPTLCELYPNTVYPGDAAVGEPPNFTRYALIALRAIYTGPNNTYGGGVCEISEAFQNDYDPAIPNDCLAKQLAALVGCKDINGNPVDYDTAGDQNDDRCVPDSGASIQLGFRVPDPNLPDYTVKDVDRFIAIVRLAAIETGMSPADADRLKALLDAHRHKVVVTDAGFDPNGDYSNSVCP